jgi:hypothetical protein
MRITRIFWLSGLTLAFILFSAYPGWVQPLGGVQPRPERRGPIITHAFAVEKGYYGYIWKIYLEAEDPDGQMLKIASVVDEEGYGHYPTDWTYLKPQYQKHFKGYLQWNTFSTKASYLPEWTRITLTVSVIDKAGNESNEVVFPFTFEITPEQYSYKLPSPFDQGDLPRLGYVMIDLYYPGEGYGNHGPGVMH